MRKKTLLRGLAVVLVAIMSLMVVVPAMAELPPEEGNLFIHKYIGIPIEQLPNDGTDIEDWVGWDTFDWPESVVAVNGVVFDVYKVDTTDGAPPAGMIYVLVEDSGDFSLEVWEADGSSLIETYELEAPISATTTGDGVAQFPGLDQGIYLVVENTVTTINIYDASDPTKELFISSPCAPFLVAVPMTNPDGDGWLTNVHVYPKNTGLTVEKEVTTNDAVVVGDVVGFSIKVSIPDDIFDSNQFDIYDILDAALDYVPNSVSVRTLIGTNTYATVSQTYYTVDYDIPTRTLSVEFTPTGRDYLAENFEFVIVSFNTTVNATILDKPGYTVYNQGVVEFRNHNGDYFEGKNPPGVTEIHTAAIEIEKVDENNTPLEGSEFMIATSAENARLGRFLKIHPTTKVLYDYGHADYDLAILELYVAKPLSPSTGEPAVARFEGLLEYTKNLTTGVKTYQTYYIVETQAPDSYNLLDKSIVVTFTGNESNHVYLCEVENTKGFTLPSTGGIGTVVFTVVGVTLIGTAVMVGITSKKKTKKSIN
ncbi:MAG: SpaH/EbpB family LPXTG-anchored major pilin [Coriobacteriia bacterium]|nr:SpaH/EbpB family LPXTG-anchored major pilin [Coriobacteriia bacterium]